MIWTNFSMIISDDKKKNFDFDFEKIFLIKFFLDNSFFT